MIETAECTQVDLVHLLTSNTSLSFYSLGVVRLEEAPERSVMQPSEPFTTELLKNIVTPAIVMTR